MPLFAIGLGVTAIVAASIAALRAGRAVVPRVATWRSPPRVWLHPDLEEFRPAVVRALEWWEALGHHTAGLLPPGAPRPEGAVRIVPAPPGLLAEWTLARSEASITVGADDLATIEGADLEDPYSSERPGALRFSSEGGYITDADIHVDPWDLPAVDVARVFAHELGHAAFGFAHVTARLGRKDPAARGVQIPPRGHLMHPRYGEGDWGDEGLHANALEADALGDPRERRRAVRAARRG